MLVSGGFTVTFKLLERPITFVTPERPIAPIEVP